MAYYSFVVMAPQPVGIPNPMVVLDKGLNVFNVELADVDEFVNVLHAESVEVKQMRRLDEFEPSQLSDLLLEGASDDET